MGSAAIQSAPPAHDNRIVSATIWRLFVLQLTLARGYPSVHRKAISNNKLGEMASDYNSVNDVKDWNLIFQPLPTLSDRTMVVL